MPETYTKETLLPAAKPAMLRTVHKISPLDSFSPGRVLAFAKPAKDFAYAPPQPPAASKPVPFAAKLLEPAKAPAKGSDPSNPVPIPGALQDSLERSRSLIKAVPAPVTAPVPIKYAFSLSHRDICIGACVCHALVAHSLHCNMKACSTDMALAHTAM